MVEGAEGGNDLGGGERAVAGAGDVGLAKQARAARRLYPSAECGLVFYRDEMVGDCLTRARLPSKNPVCG